MPIYFCACGAVAINGDLSKKKLELGHRVCVALRRRKVLLRKFAFALGPLIALTKLKLGSILAANYVGAHGVHVYELVAFFFGEVFCGGT